MGDLLIMVFCLLIGLIIGYKIGRGKRYVKPVGKEFVDKNAALYGFEPAKDVLSKLIRAILWDLHLTPYQWEQLVQAFINDSTNGYARDTTHAKRVVRGNLNKEIRASTVTWKVFLKFLKILKPRSVQFRVDITMQAGTRSVNSIDLNSLDYVRSDG